MDNTILITLSAQNALMRKLEVASNNMANVSTAGFKSEEVLFQPMIQRPASIVENPTTVAFVRDYSIARDFRPGALQQTGNPLDLALTGDGFFEVQGNNQTLYTRDGQFTMDTTGRLVTQNGDPVLDIAGQPIILNVNAGDPAIAKDGTIRQNNVVMGQIAIANFNRPGALKKIGDNLYQQAEEEPTRSNNYEIVQGMVEGSNVNAIHEITDILEISRAFEQATKLQKQAEDLRTKAIEKLAKVS